MTDRELMQQALEALENNLEVMKADWEQIDQEWGPSQGGLQAAVDGTLTGYEYFKDTISTITALRERLAQPEREKRMNNIVKQPPLPNAIAFTHDNATEVMRITKEGVWVNPDMSVEESAKAVLDALDSQIKVLVQAAITSEREACARIAEEPYEFTSNESHQIAAAIRSRK